MSPAFDLAGRRAIITGGASDMGAASASALSAAGAHVWLADVDEARLGAVVAALPKGAGSVTAVPTDVRIAAAVDALVARAVDERGGLDVMANVAGLICDGAVVDTDVRDLDRVLDVNLRGVYFGCQAAARQMLAQGSGSIVNMASLAAFTPLPNLSVYAMSKAAVVALTRVLAAEVGPKGVRVNAIAPGYVEGGMTQRRARDAEGRIDAGKLEASREAARRRNPLRITGTPEDVAHALCYLASDASRYMTGQVLHLNGGHFMP